MARLTTGWFSSSSQKGAVDDEIGVDGRAVFADLSRIVWRHLIENFFGKLKELKRIALRAYKTDASFAAMIYAAATILNSK